MHLTKRRLLTIIIVSSISVPIIQIVTALSIQGIYGCATTQSAECAALLNSATITTMIGIGLVYAALAIDLIAILTFIYFLITKKK